MSIPEVRSQSLSCWAVQESVSSESREGRRWRGLPVNALCQQCPPNTLDYPNRSLTIPSPTKSRCAGNTQQAIPNTVLFISYRLLKSIYSLLLSLPSTSTKSYHGLILLSSTMQVKPSSSPTASFFFLFSFAGNALGNVSLPATGLITRKIETTFFKFTKETFPITFSIFTKGKVSDRWDKNVPLTKVGLLWSAVINRGPEHNKWHQFLLNALVKYLRAFGSTVAVPSSGIRNRSSIMCLCKL